MPLKKGGVKLTDKSLTSWQAVWFMLNVVGAQISLVTADSLTGIVFRLDVPNISENSKFKGINKAKLHTSSRNLFDQDVYSLVFKVSLLTPTVKEYFLNINRKRKNTSVLMNMIKETSIQQEVFCSTIVPSGYPVTISVVDFSYFDVDCARVLLDQFKKKTSDDFTKSLLEELKQKIVTNSDVTMGLITMELVESNFDTMYKITKNNIEPTIKDTDYEHVIAQMIILLLTTGIIHYDLHLNNAFGSLNPINLEDNNRSYIIDYERAVRITVNFVKSLNKIGTMSLFQKIESLAVTDLYPPESSEAQDKLIESFENIIKFIESIDYTINNRTYGSLQTQSISFIKYLYPRYESNNPKFLRTSDNINKYLRISRIIYNLTSTSTGTIFTKRNIQQYLLEGEIFSVPSFEGLTPDEIKEKCSQLYFRNNLILWSIKGENVRQMEIKDTFKSVLPMSMQRNFTKSAQKKHATRGKSARKQSAKMVNASETQKLFEKLKEERIRKKEERKRKKAEIKKQEYRYRLATLTAKNIGSPYLSNEL
jgi:hypothetical protein